MIRQTWRDDAPIVIYIGLYWAVCSIVWWITDHPNIKFASVVLNGTLLIGALFIFLCLQFLYILARNRPDRPIKFLIHFYLQYKPITRIVAAGPIFAAILVFWPVFSVMKSSISIYTNFTWDNAFIYADQVIHGLDAWQVFRWIFHIPYSVFLINIFYHVWITLLYVGVPLVALDFDRPQLRSQFLITLVLGWSIIGNGLAMIFASVGPCFVEAVHGNAQFAPLMAKLHAVDGITPLMTLKVQAKLLASQMATDNSLGSGISAMPSIHVHTAFLFALWASKVSRPAAIGFGAFFIIIMIGSVVTGYHYAVDGYVAIVLTMVLWWFSGVFLRWRSGRGYGSFAVDARPLPAG